MMEFRISFENSVAPQLLELIFGMIPRGDGKDWISIKTTCKYFRDTADKTLAPTPSDVDWALQNDKRECCACLTRGNALDHLWKGNLHRYLENFQEALLHYNTHLKEIPDHHGTVLNNRALVYHKMGLFDDAMQDYDLANAMLPQDPAILGNRADLKSLLGKHRQALEDYARSLQIYPHSSSVLCGQGLTYHKIGSYEDAINSFNQAIKVKPCCATTFSHRGETFRVMGKLDFALADFNSSISKKPIAATINNRGLTYEKKGDLSRALADFHKCVQTSPDDMVFRGNRANVIHLLGRFHEALKDFEVVISARPSAAALSNRCSCYILMGKYQEALTDINRAIDIDRHPIDIGKRAIVYALLGQRDAAMTDLLNVTAKLSMRDLHYFGARAALHLGDYDQALKEFNIALELDPKNINATFWKGVVLVKLNQKDTARKFLDIACDAIPDHWYFKTQRMELL
eukprot:TRINITY_DN11356_c0_g1_i1.p1 TRINITY_DN11356_c0_g1~~TRINITY_DN11356_c0_g1_i1.p1  ORF type:complete len:459 (+),score=81.96 TRINITY_DN11356_c0_g1_i1:93-1469(+)